MNFAFPVDKGEKGIKIDQETKKYVFKRVFGPKIFNFNIENRIF